MVSFYPLFLTHPLNESPVWTRALQSCYVENTGDLDYGSVFVFLRGRNRIWVGYCWFYSLHTFGLYLKGKIQLKNFCSFLVIQHLKHRNTLKNKHMLLK